MSVSSIKKQKLLLIQVLEQAVLTDVLQRIFVQGVQMPLQSHNTKVIIPYSKMSGVRSSSHLFLIHAVESFSIP
jgi:hypothetical protein